MWAVVILIPLAAWFFDRLDVLLIITYFFAVGAFFNDRFTLKALNHIRELLLDKGVAEPIDLLEDDDPIRQLVDARKRAEEPLRRLKEDYPDEEEAEEKP